MVQVQVIQVHAPGIRFEPQKRLWKCFGCALALSLLAAPSAHAQNFPTPDDALSAAVLQALQQPGGDQLNASELQPTTDIRVSQPLQIAVRPPEQREPSNLERLFSDRVGQRVEQFGYDVFGGGGQIVLRQSGALQDDYVLGQGDEVVATFRGPQNLVFRTRVDRDGRVVLQGLAPVTAAGRTLADVRDDLEDAAAAAYAGTQVFVTVGEVRQITVRVVGEVEIPGAHNLTSLSTVLDALTLSGGVKTTGSLRNIQIVRGGQTMQLDLYGFLTNQNVDDDISLVEGDRIIVPLMGPAVAVVGGVRRPAIYELAPAMERISITELSALAGGPTIRGAYRYSVLRTRADGRREFGEAQLEPNVFVEDGEALFVDPAVDVSLARVELAGTVNLRGFYALGDVPTLRSLLSSTEMFLPSANAPSPYMLLAGIVRIDATALQRTVIPFSPVNVINGITDVPLQSDDVVYILNYQEMHSLAETAASFRESARLFVDEGPSARRSQGAVGEAGSSERTSQNAFGEFGPSTQTSQGAFGETGRPAQTSQGAFGETGRSAQSSQGAYGQVGSEPSSSLNLLVDEQQLRFPTGAGLGDVGLMESGQAAAKNFSSLMDDERQLMLTTLGDYFVTVSGAVNNPGAYLAAPGTTLDRVIQAAGGVTPRVDLNAVEVTSAEIDNALGLSRTIRQTHRLDETRFSQLVLRPYDRVRFNEVFSDRDDGEVTMFGEVRYPGSYEILRGERLSSVLARAGGLTDVAYPYGAIFLRRSVADTQRVLMRRQADEIENQIATLIGSSAAGRQTSEADIQYILQISDRLRSSDGPGGRVAVQIDPAQLIANPERDVVLEPGDRLYVPRRPAAVVVAGEVLAPNGIQYQAGLSVADYIERAGGTNQIADSSRIFVIHPDGSAVRAGGAGSLFSYQNTALAPGSVIVVPRNLRPFNLTAFLTTFTQITGQLAVTAASIAVISR